jgi:hypothetical protein
MGSPNSHAESAAVLGRYGDPEAERAVAIPLVVRGKAAAVLYADSGVQPDGMINTEALETLLRVTSMAIELLPVRRSTEQAPRPAAQHAAPASQPVAVTPPAPPVFYGGMGEEQPARVEPTFPVESQPSFQAEGQPSAFAQAVPAAQPEMAEGEEAPSAPQFEMGGHQGAAATSATSSTGGVGAAAEMSQPTAVPGTTNEAEVRAHNDARRFARLLVSEIKLYNEAKVAEGRRSYDLYERLKDDIDRSRQMYEKRVSPSVAAKFDYFYDELVHTLGEGDTTKLGRGCPGPTVPV